MANTVNTYYITPKRLNVSSFILQLLLDKLLDTPGMYLEKNWPTDSRAVVIKYNYNKYFA